MQNRLLWALLVIAAVSVGLEAHHSFSAQFDVQQPVVLKGKVTRVRLMMPHAFVYLLVPDEKGKPVEWAVEFGNPNQLFRSGWKKDTVQPGTAITIKGSRARDGSNLAHGVFVQLVDGRVILGQGRPTEVAASTK